MATTNLGKVTNTPVGEWDSNLAYEVLDIVSYQGESYISKKNVPQGVGLTDTTYWMKLVVKGSKGDKGNKGDKGDTGATGNGISSVEVEETSVVGNVHTYTLTISMTDGTSEVFTYDVTDGAVTSVNGRTGAVTGLAEDNGYYDEMTVGGAEQLISSTYVDDSVPYVFRTSGGSADIGDREFDELVGGSIAWNQLAREIADTYYARLNCTASYSSGVATVTNSGTDTYGLYLRSTYRFSIIGHKYFVSATINSDTAINNVGKVGLDGVNSPITASANVETTISTIQSATVANNAFVVYLQGNSATIKNAMCIDLTQMFGSAIADYIYSLEQSSSGSGVAWFRSLFPKPYYAYNAGQLISVSGLSAHKMTGFNQWDGTYDSDGYIRSEDGTISSSNNYVATDYIRVVPNMTYFMSPTAGANPSVCWYDADKNYIGGTKYNNATSMTETAPSNAYYMRASISVANINAFCINLHWDGKRDGEYEPYTVHEYALDDSLTLRGVPKLNSANEMYFDGDVYSSDGSVRRRFAEVDLGSLTWSYVSADSVFYATISDKKDGQAGVRCSKYVTGGLTGYSTPDYYIGQSSSSSLLKCIFISDPAYTDATSFKSAMNGVMLVYELATPTTESAEPYTSPQWVDDFGTEEYVIAEQSGVAIPVGHETKYTANLKAKLEMAPNSPSGDGDYIVRQTGGINTYVPLTDRIPNAPSENGNYILKCTVSGSTVTYTWEAQS